MVIHDGEETFAGGALRGLGDGVGEIKRMWTAPQAAAVALYRSVGYVPTEAYGMFREDPRFVYYEKRLS